VLLSQLLLQLLFQLLWKLQVLLLFSSQVNGKRWGSLDFDHRRLCTICKQNNHKMRNRDGGIGGKIWSTLVSAYL